MEKKEESFESSLQKLENLVKDLENGDVALDDAINKYTEAMKLSKICSEKLKNTEEAINKIVKDDGSIENFEAVEE